MREALRLTPLPVVLLLVGLVQPLELSLFIGSLRIPPHRVVLIVFFFLAVFQFLRSRPITLRPFDFLFFTFAVWTVVVFILHLGMKDGLEFGGALALESFCAYFIARVYIRDLETCRAALVVLFLMVCAVALLAVPEALLGRLFVHETLQPLTGYYFELKYETRLGLTRAYSTFDHPILYGSFCASLLAVMWYLRGSLATRVRRVVTVIGATFLALSSAPLLCCMVQLALISWERVTRGIPGRVQIVAVLLFLGYVVLEVASERPAIEAIVTRIVLDSWTAFYRVLIWQYGMENVWANPWLGLGLSDWTRPWWMHSASVDSFWLVIMLRQGIPSLLIFLIALCWLTARVHHQAKNASQEVRDLVMGWTMSLIALGLVGLTVHYWNNVYAFLFFFLGLVGWVADPKQAWDQLSEKVGDDRAAVTEQAPRIFPRPIGSGVPRPLSPGVAAGLPAMVMRAPDV